MPQSLHVLSAHIVFSTKERHPWLTKEIRPLVWGYLARILQNLECHSITVGGVDDHIHILCNLTKKHATMKVMEVVKKEEHHRTETFQDELLRLLKKYGVEYDERYLWD